MKGCLISPIAPDKRDYRNVAIALQKDTSDTKTSQDFALRGKLLFLPAKSRKPNLR